MSTLVSEGTSIERAIAAEENASPGLYEIRFYLTEPISQGDIASMRESLLGHGVNLKGIRQRKSGGLWYVGVKYVKEPVPEGIAFLPVAIIPLIAFGFISVLVGIGIFKIEDISKLIILGGGFAVILVALLRKPIESAAAGYARRA